MWQNLEGKLGVTTAALSNLLNAVTLAALMERLAALSRRIT